MQAYLLAAGDGKRAGGPKAWLEHEGKPLLRRHVDFMLKRFEPRDIAVSIQPAWLERCRKLSGRVQWTGVDPKLSPLASLQTLLRARPAETPFFVWHVDQPVWNHDLFDRLAARVHTVAGHSMYSVEAARPVFEGKRGHPVLLTPELGLRILALNPISERLDVFLQGRVVVDVDAGSSLCLENWNEGAPA